jgi:hypothetical protein
VEVNKRKIVSLVKVTKAVLSQTGMGVSFIGSVSDKIFAMLIFLQNRLWTTWRTAADHNLRNTGLESVPLHKPAW